LAEIDHIILQEERRLYGDKAYVGQEEAICARAPQARNFMERPAARKFPLSVEKQRRNRKKAAIRSRVEHVFGVIKHIFGWRKVRFKGIAKNLQYAYGVAAAVNIYLHRRTLGKLFGGGSELPLGVS